SKGNIGEGLVRFDLQHGKVGARVGADQLGIKLLAVIGDDDEVGAALDDVIVRDEVAVTGNEEPRTLCNGARTLLARTLRTRALTRIAELALAAELTEEAVQRMIARQVLKARHAEREAVAAIACRIDLCLDPDAHDGRL